MLKINSPLFKLITILFRQMNLSIGRYSTEEDFYAYFNDKHKYYKYAIKQLERKLYEPVAYSSFTEMIKNTFFIRQLSSLNVLLIYKVLKEFDEMLDCKNFHYMLKEKKNKYFFRGDLLGTFTKKTTSKRKDVN